jgi:hypothetical protein
LDQEQTRIVTLTRRPDLGPDERVHCLELAEGAAFGRRYEVGSPGVTIGRAPPADIVLADSEVSRTHCRVTLLEGTFTITDLNSTNGTFVDGVRVSQGALLPVGAILQVGRLTLKHVWRTRGEMLQSDQLDHDLQKASDYVQALLPPPLRQGPIRTDWVYHPCAKLGGDAFGYGPLADGKVAGYLIDVSGHGAGAAMHSVQVMNLLRQKALPNTDMARPGEVLNTLNALFQMEQHADMYFTIWYGVYDQGTRRLDFASGGHHPAYLVTPERQEVIPLRTRNPLIGAVPGKTFEVDSIAVPPGSSIYVFSDGVFEIVTTDGAQWGLRDFLPLILQPPVTGLGESQRLFQEVTKMARPGGLDDDFSMVVLTFD